MSRLERCGAPAFPSAAGARDLTVRSFDGTPIAAHFFAADGLPAGARAPLVMLAHGYAERGPARRDAVLAGMPASTGC